MKLLIIFVICVIIYGVLTTPSPPCKEVTDPVCHFCCRYSDKVLNGISRTMKNKVSGSYNSPIKNCNTCKIHVPDEAYERSGKTCHPYSERAECPVQPLTVKLLNVNVTCTCKFASKNKKAESGLMNIVWQQDPKVSLKIKRCGNVWFSGNSIQIEIQIYNHTVVNPVASVDILRKCEGSKQFIKECMIFAQSLKNEDMEKHVLNIALIYFPPKKLDNGVDPMKYHRNICTSES